MDWSLGLSPKEVVYWVGQAATASLAAAAVIESGRKRFDLFGILVVAFTAALGGGSLRDVLLDRPVFWIGDPTYLAVALGSALLTFFAAARWTLSARVFLITDAIGLALFTVVGTQIALRLEVHWLPASFLGVFSGVMGGILRDILCNEEPLVFRGPLYATAAWAGSLFYVLLLPVLGEGVLPSLLAGLLILGIRWAAVRWSLQLPSFRSPPSKPS